MVSFLIYQPGKPNLSVWLRQPAPLERGARVNADGEIVTPWGQLPLKGEPGLHCIYLCFA